jgi:hypothetical protein
MTGVTGLASTGKVVRHHIPKELVPAPGSPHCRIDHVPVPGSRAQSRLGRCRPMSRRVRSAASLWL